MSRARNTLDIHYLTLYQKYLAVLIDSNPIIQKYLNKGFVNVVSNIPNFQTESKENLN